MLLALGYTIPIVAMAVDDEGLLKETKSVQLDSIESNVQGMEFAELLEVFSFVLANNIVVESDLVGFFTMRRPTEGFDELRFGFVVVDPEKRGKGYGKSMLQLGVKFAKEIYGAKKVSLGVFENNKSAYFCYKAVGFQDVVLEETEKYVVLGEEWKCLELEMTL